MKVLGVLAGADMPGSQLSAWVSSAEVILAADGGADRLHAIGVVPSATVGDLDSITDATAAVQTRLLREDDQNSTDCDKLLALAFASGYSSVTLIGAEGDLLDHVLGTVQSAARSPLSVRLALRRGIGWFMRGPAESLARCQAGGRLSVIPLDTCSGVSLRGTRWELEEAVLDPFGLTSLSNVAERSSVQISLKSGHAFVFVETDGGPSWT